MRIVIVEWVDAFSSCTVWTNREDDVDLHLVKAICVGILFRETEDSISIILGLDEVNYSQALTIPKGCIKRMRQLRVNPSSSTAPSSLR